MVFVYEGFLLNELFGHLKTSAQLLFKREIEVHNIRFQ